ncbi:uncharacterized protein GVI51_F03817 [Nakaseomyces glabratus]|uniref:Uncharacterized protein n=2 Tax=Candida glabrata TaxID=5478 RepID=Q6FUE1_CANGA|nr:uncharacterized protein CAGL0F04191g [Nakaseomyces glabratus]KAH7587642.1 hypothetical protein J7298_01411 [Nakaseomyces glabratus]KAH7589455.1 hypothetical protein J7297_01404 [Nakaseomyces glabratus]KAH7594626.1 hypothetical protein J7296_01406 [Nakaseomyces glabratus]KAH7604125.1 hypothetical protein J7295_01417 [Nakaseomyces glabratus]KAH7605110.1 hypothetical protein J7294_01403 [Nakaseomyces glabratus]|eukprot:XP_446153.1 uncharacterized protein CAGL0F04191g [[Candida] glabrata]
MFLFIPLVCGLNSWDKPYTKVQTAPLYCPHCHNYSVQPVKRRQFFSVWFIPLVPLHVGKQLHCNICNWRQDFHSKEQLEKVIAEQGNIKA